MSPKGPVAHPYSWVCQWTPEELNSSVLKSPVPSVPSILNVPSYSLSSLDRWFSLVRPHTCPKGISDIDVRLIMYVQFLHWFRPLSWCYLFVRLVRSLKCVLTLIKRKCVRPHLSGAFCTWLIIRLPMTESSWESRFTRGFDFRQDLEDCLGVFQMKGSLNWRRILLLRFI